MPSPGGKFAVGLAPVLPHVSLDPERRIEVEACADVAAALRLLESGGDLVGGVTLAAHALPKREAVWWACMCARAVPSSRPSGADIAALEAAELWVRRPEEAQRRACMAAAQAGRFDSPEAWAAVGAFWSGGSMSAPETPTVAPPEHLTGAAVAGAVRLASVREKPQLTAQRLALFLKSAHEIAAGGAGRMAPEPG